jgi:hypothetical protein
MANAGIIAASFSPSPAGLESVVMRLLARFPRSSATPKLSSGSGALRQAEGLPLHFEGLTIGLAAPLS